MKELGSAPSSCAKVCSSAGAGGRGVGWGLPCAAARRAGPIADEESEPPAAVSVTAYPDDPMEKSKLSAMLVDAVQSRGLSTRTTKARPGRTVAGEDDDIPLLERSFKVLYQNSLSGLEAGRQEFRQSSRAITANILDSERACSFFPSFSRDRTTSAADCDSTGCAISDFIV